MLSSCDLSSVKSANIANECTEHTEYTGVGRQIPLNIQVSKTYAEIYDVKLVENISFRGKSGIAVNFNCNAYGFKGFPLYFYAYVLYENDYDFVLKRDGSKTCGFDVTPLAYDATKFDGGITLYISYEDLPARYHGELCVDIVIIDGFDNIIATKSNNRFFYTTL